MPLRVPFPVRETRAALHGGRARAPVPVQEVTVLRALLVGLCACVLVAQAAAAAKRDPQPTTAPSKATQERSAPTLDDRLARKLAATRKYRGTVAFFKRHRQLLSSATHRENAALALEHAQHRLAQLEGTIARSGARSRPRRSATRSAAAAGCDLRGLRQLLQRGRRGRLVRVPADDDRAKRTVPRSLPDGLVRAEPVRPRDDGPRAGACSAQVLRALRSGLEPLELSLGGKLAATFSSQSAARGVPFGPPSARCPPYVWGQRARPPSDLLMRLPRTPAAMASATTTSGS